MCCSAPWFSALHLLRLQSKINATFSTATLGAMSQSLYRIRCWLHNRKGLSYAVELREANGQFVGLRQDESGSTIASIHERGTIDRAFPVSEFSVPADAVFSVLSSLTSSVVPAVPTMTGGLDGANYHVQIANGESVSHFSWWLNAPEQWSSLKLFWEQIVALSRS
jgi:hypothetical protein